MKNWKSSLFGFIAATVEFVGQGMTLKAALLAAALLGLGLVSKDYDKSGTPKSDKALKAMGARSE